MKLSRRGLFGLLGAGIGAVAAGRLGKELPDGSPWGKPQTFIAPNRRAHTVTWGSETFTASSHTHVVYMRLDDLTGGKLVS